MNWQLDLGPLLQDLKTNFSTNWDPKPFPSGCIVVDLGGSTLRVAKTNYSTLEHTHIELVTVQARQAPLDWLAQVLDHLQVPPFNLCWAFPLKDGCLQPMGKGWCLAPQLIGKDLACELNARLKTTRVLHVVHDAVSSLMAQHVHNVECRVAITWGTGYNVAVYVDHQLINCEMGMAGVPPFGDPLRLEWFDLELEKRLAGQTPNMPLERMAGGAYLGELYSIATGVQKTTNELWPLVTSRDPMALFIVTRACHLVATTIRAATKLTGSIRSTVAYTGGVIFEPVVLDLLTQELQAAESHTGSFHEITLVAQKHGPELGATLA